jgi:hypothetical protein
MNVMLLAELQVERAQGLVEEQHGRAVHERARERDALLLAAGELGGAPLRLSGEAHALELLAHAPADLGLVHLLALEPERDVLLDAPVREQRVALEDGVRRALEGREARHVVAVEQDAALGGLLEARDHAQRGGLPAPRRPEHREELAARDVEIHLAHGCEVAEALGDALEPDARGFRARLDLMAHA